MLILAFLIWISTAIACAVIATDKGRSGFGWFFLGLVLGLFALVMIACLSRVDHGQRQAA